MHVYLGQRRVAVDPARSLGKGGEADVYDIGGLALKLWKQPEHPDLKGLPQEQAAARVRLDLQQEKLRRFPTALPARVVSPSDLALDRARGGRIIGYAMPIIAPAEPLFRMADRAFRQGRIGQDAVVALLRDLRRTLAALHGAGVVVGDLNDRNTLCQGPWQGDGEAACHLIDADSWQFAGFPSLAYTDRFLDPLLCDPRGAALQPVRPQSAESDWYAFAALLMQSLLYVGPYGGVHKPPRPSQAVPAPLRPLRRLTVFRPEVRYPRPALPYDALPDELLDELQAIFERDRRGPFPARLLDELRFKTCQGCGAEHARASCPRCRRAEPVVAVAASGAVRCRVALRTRGVILCASAEGGALRWLVLEDGALRREDGRALDCAAELDLARAQAPGGGLAADLRFELDGAATCVARGGRLLRLEPGRPDQVYSVEHVAGRPSLAGPFFCGGGQLLRQGAAALGAAEHVGDVLAGQTRIFTGAGLGFGLYRAGALFGAFVFSGARRGLRDGLLSDPRDAMRGELLDAGCVFGDGRIWLRWTAQEGPSAVSHLRLLGPDGAVLARCDDEPWLAQLGGACAAGPHLLVPSDDGVLRAEASGGVIRVARSFPATAPFVDGAARLLATREGLAVVTDREIRVLQLQ